MVFISEVDTAGYNGYIHIPPLGHNGDLKLTFNKHSFIFISA